VASAERVLARQDGPTVLVGHSFSGMIVTEAGMHPNVIRDGLLHVPDVPGVGLEWNEEVVAANQASL
jgi:L-alanine-DL-glutamate epimerase-like enolase superfamily enzyme